MTPTEKLFQQNLQISLKEQDNGIKDFIANMKKILRVSELKKLASSNSISNTIELKTLILEPVESGNKTKDCIELSDGSYYRKAGTFLPSMMEGRNLQTGQIITFSLENISLEDYYCYLLDISPDGKIEVIFPNSRHNADAALIRSGKLLDISQRVGLMLSNAGEETVKLIAARNPVDVSILGQPEFKKNVTRGAREFNPLERLLTSAVHGMTRGKISLRRYDWGTDQYSFKVE